MMLSFSSNRPSRRGAGSASARAHRGRRRVRAAMAADRVDLVHEDDARRGLLRLSKSPRTREAPTPTNISTKSEPEMEKNKDPRASRGGARGASCRYRAAREQHAQDPRASAWNFSGFSGNSLISCSSPGGSSTLGDVLEADLRRVRGHPLGAGLPEGHPRAAALHLVHQEDPEGDQITNGRSEVGSDHQGDPPTAFESKLTPSSSAAASRTRRRFPGSVATLIFFLVVAARRLVLDRQLLLARVGNDLLDWPGFDATWTGARSR